jgi:hypothetical protein
LASFVADILGREKLMHIVPLNIARQIDRAKVAKRAIFATRKSLNSQTVQNMKSPLSNPHARTGLAMPKKITTPCPPQRVEKPSSALP